MRMNRMSGAALLLMWVGIGGFALSGCAPTQGSIPLQEEGPGFGVIQPLTLEKKGSLLCADGQSGCWMSPNLDPSNVMIGV